MSRNRNSVEVTVRRGIIIHPEELTKKWIDRASDAGVNVLGLHPRGGEIAPQTLKELLSSLSDGQYRAQIDYAKALGIEIEYEIHAAGYLMPKRLFEEHPEYFRMNESGVRTSDYNLCVSNVQALKIFSKNAAELSLKLYGSSDKYYFWMDDGRGLRCHCDKCRSLSASDQQLIATAAMLKEMRKHNPNAKLAYLAYVDSIEPPTLKVDEGIFLEFAPFEKYTAKGDGAEERILNEKRKIKPLLDCFGKEDAKVLEYWYDNSLYSKWKKPPAKFVLNKDAMQSDIAEYISLGFSEITSFACFLGDDYEALWGEVDISDYTASFPSANKQ